jgi:DNA primase
MPLYKQESLDLLRQRIDLAEALSAHIDLKRAGASYKALCPFHEEKTPSFVINKGDTHYHCFGCGAHGDAIAFLMGYMKMNFTDAVEHLAERFQVVLELEENDQQKKGPSKALLKSALEESCRFYHFMLLHSEMGKEALDYLYKRGIDLEFINAFKIGFAPKQPDLFQRFMHEKRVSDLILEQAGLISTTSSGRKRDFFSDRITFPIRDAMGSVIGYSARKFKEETFGGKYINTPETALFKKSHVLFGLSDSRQRIAKERKAIVVEGQIDALRLIHAGFNFTVAGQGTAFGESHVLELCHLGVSHVYLALDADKAGQEAAVKIGDLFQKKGVEVSVLTLPDGMDPDSFLREFGPPAFAALLEKGLDYLTFLFNHFSKNIDLSSPSAKNECVQTIALKIRAWEQPVMVHESVRKLAKIANVPETVLGTYGQVFSPMPHVKKRSHVAFAGIDPDRILEVDLLRWLFLKGETLPELIELVKKNLEEHHFLTPFCRELFSFYLEAYAQKKPLDLFALGIQLDSPEHQQILTDIMQKKVNLQKAEEGVRTTLEKILQRDWMLQCDTIMKKIQSGACSDTETLELAKQFDAIKKNPPKVL